MLAVLFASSRWGIGILADSTVYVGAARLLLSTGQLQALDPQGRAIPWIHTAPFFPATLAAAAALLRIDPVVAAQGLCAICFGITVGLVGWVGWRWLGSARFGVLAALLTLIATPMVDIYTAALSEPLYLVLALGALVLLAHYLESPNRKLLVAAAVLSALAILTRYAGAALLGGEGLVLLFLPRNRPWTIRIRDLSLFSFLAGAPIALWLIRNRLATGRSTTATVSLGHLSGSLVSRHCRATFRPAAGAQDPCWGASRPISAGCFPARSRPRSSSLRPYR
jgi:4-amino-4-deoxy-L-arabinose transferase-like glycosyltransferase